MKNLYFLLILFQCSNFIVAQSHKNTFLIGTGMLHIPTKTSYVYFKPQLISFSYISYERKINQKFGVGLSYSQWRNEPGNKRSSYGVLYSLPLDPANLVVDSIHPLEREKYRFFDISMSYSLLNKKRHALNCSAGLSIANGWNYYVIRIIEYQRPDYVERHRVYAPEKNESYWGFSSNARYNALFFKQRLLLGVNVKYSYYFNAISQFNYCFVAGFNF